MGRSHGYCLLCLNSIAEFPQHYSNALKVLTKCTTQPLEAAAHLTHRVHTNNTYPLHSDYGQEGSASL